MKLPKDIKRLAFEAAALAFALTIVWILAGMLMRSHDFAARNGQPVFGDFVSFWAAGKAVLEGHVADVHDRTIMLAYQKTAIPGLKFYAPWNAPPTFLLITPLLALAPYPVAALLFLGASIAFYVFAAIKLLPDKRALIFALTAPAAVYQLGSVQTALVIAAATGLALYWLDKRPLASGAVVGVLAIKPHLAVLWPVMLALTGRWRAFFAAALSVIAFAGLGALAFGPESYVRFLHNLSRSADLFIHQRITTPSYASLFGNLRQMHVPITIAGAAHAVSAVAALLTALWIFLRGDTRAQGAALCAATLLLSPYIFFYDGLLLAVGAAVLGRPQNKLETAAFVLAWGAGATLTLGYFLTPLPLCPLAAWLMLLVAARRAAASAHPSKTAPPPPRSEQSSTPAEA